MSLDAFPDSQGLSPHRRFSKASDRVSRSRTILFPVIVSPGLSREETGLTPQSGRLLRSQTIRNPHSPIEP
jgi:hypothetical protein